jgi:23S rRNA pseudouridine1911/1915/1917 synthase
MTLLNKKVLLFNKKLQEITSPLPGSIPKTIHYKLSVKLKFEGLTLLDLYATSFPKVDRSEWLKKINEGKLTVNGKICSPDKILKAGWITENTVYNKTEPTVSNNIQFIFEDDNLLIINKPSPLPMHPSGRFFRNTLIEILKLMYPSKDLKIVHRLDANTTGIVILAKNSLTANSISQQFQNNTIQKEYRALVEGIIEKDQMKIESSIGTEKISAGGRSLSETGKKSETILKVIKRDIENNQTLLAVHPKNGRTNQIRLHLASINHPIVGDLGYKNESYFKNNPLTYPTDSLFLHAHKINFIYNNTETQMIAEIPSKF